MYFWIKLRGFQDLHLITIRLYAEGKHSYTPASVGVFILLVYKTKTPSRFLKP